MAEQAGGAASNGRQRVMELIPNSLHERTPLFLGSKRDVEDCELFVQEKHPAIRVDRRAASPARTR